MLKVCGHVIEAPIELAAAVFFFFFFFFIYINYNVLQQHGH